MISASALRAAPATTTCHRRRRDGAEGADPEERDVVQRDHVRTERTRSGRSRRASAERRSARCARDRRRAAAARPRDAAGAGPRRRAAWTMCASSVQPSARSAGGAAPAWSRRSTPASGYAARERRHEAAQVGLGAARDTPGSRNSALKRDVAEGWHRRDATAAAADGLLRLARAAGLLPRRDAALPRPTTKLLDVGCGTAWLAEPLRRLHGHRRLARRGRRGGARPRPQRHARRRRRAAAVRGRRVRRASCSRTCSSTSPTRSRSSPRRGACCVPGGPRVRVLAGRPALGVGRLHAPAPVHPQGVPAAVRRPGLRPSSTSATSR